MNRFPVTENTSKYDEFFRTMSSYDVSIAAIQEVGINWSVIHQDHHLSKVARNNLGPTAKATTAHNTNSGTNSRSQWGGTALISQDTISKYAMGRGADPSGRVNPSLQKAWKFLLSPLAHDDTELPTNLSAYASTLITLQEDSSSFSIPLDFSLPYG